MIQAVTFLGWWKRDLLERLSDLQLGDEKDTAWITWRSTSCRISPSNHARHLGWQTAIIGTGHDLAVFFRTKKGSDEFFALNMVVLFFSKIQPWRQLGFFPASIFNRFVYEFHPFFPSKGFTNLIPSERRKIQKNPWRHLPTFRSGKKIVGIQKKVTFSPQRENKALPIAQMVGFIVP